MSKGKKKRKRKAKSKVKSHVITASATTSFAPATIKVKSVHVANQTLLPINIKKLREVCLATEDDFMLGDWLNKLPQPKIIDTPNGKLIHFDMGSPILGVAHLDSHGAKYNHFQRVGDRIYTASLDDRLGAYIITIMLDQARFPHDILLTTNEEAGLSTADRFTSERQYNWIFEFDRGGTDTVLYDYEDTETKKLVEAYGWDVGIGSYTDISDLEHLKCKAFNFAAGYENYHERYAYAPIANIEASVKKFTAFYREQKDNLLEHTATDWGYGYRGKFAASGYHYHKEGYWAADSTQRYEQCEWCGNSFDRWGGQNYQDVRAIQSSGFCVGCTATIEAEGGVVADDATLGQWEDVEEEDENDYPFGDETCPTCGGTGNCAVCDGSGLCVRRKVSKDEEKNLDLLIEHTKEECEHCEAGTCKYCNGWGKCSVCEGVGYHDGRIKE